VRRSQSHNVDVGSSPEGPGALGTHFGGSEQQEAEGACENETRHLIIIAERKLRRTRIGLGWRTCDRSRPPTPARYSSIAAMNMRESGLSLADAAIRLLSRPAD
jgi:hypothetical protein